MRLFTSRSLTSVSLGALRGIVTVRPVALALGIGTVAGCAHHEALPRPVPVEVEAAEGMAARRVAEHVEGLASLGYSGVLMIGTVGDPQLRIAFGWADRDPRRPQTLDTAHYWASVAKTFTAVVTFRLVEEGVLGLDDPIAKYLPDAPPDKAGITVRQLLAHTAGLTTYHDLDVRRLDRDEALDRILAAPLEAEPGTSPSYSNSGYTLVARVLEIASGEGFQELVAREVLDPAGLQASGWEGSRLGVPLAHGYLDGNDRGAPDDRASWTLLGAGGMTGTAMDLFRYGSALVAGRLLEDESWRVMTSPTTGPPDPVGGHDNALGWKTWRDDEGRLVVEKGGSSDSGFQSLLRLYPDEDAIVVVLLNTRDVPYVLAKDIFANRIVRLWRGESQQVPPVGAARVGFDGEWIGEAGFLQIAEDEVGGTNVTAGGQELVDVILNHDPDTRVEVREANRRTELVFRAALGGDMETAETFLGSDHESDVVSSFERLIEAGWSRFEVLGSSREFFRDASGLVTYVRLTKDDDEELHTRLHWDPQGRTRAVGGSAFPWPVLAVAVPLGDERAVIHHPGLGTNASLRVEDGQAVIESSAGRVVLRVGAPR